MLIECRQRRDARPNKRVGRKDLDLGSKSKVHGKNYWFRPQPDLIKNGGDPLAHVCVVDDPIAIQRYLGIAEAYNEHGKPPRVAPEGQTFATGGQPAIKTVLLDAEDDLGRRDSEPFVSDPLARARELQAEWVQDMLDRSVHDIVKAVAGLNETEIDLLLVGESKGQQRTELLSVLAPVQDVSGENLEIKME
jgi:hypothetical protein